ncbi:MAG: sodium:proton exchanger [Tenericutes bacterium HGW-Tenericutes-6]|jgi:cation:H+ antiporter|nr:MAG: sodium:proton exchanger [Tenericutes bacterium HGW-Tenericutes-6]
MDILFHILLLIFGFICLIKGADFFVLSSSSIARKKNVSPLIIGLTLVAFGTSLPELAVSFVASITVQPGQTSDIAMGNVVGSNIVNITLILGLTALFRPVPVSPTMHKREFPFLMIITLIVTILALFFQSHYVITWWEGLILLILFIFYLYLMISNKNQPMEVIEIKVIDHKKSILLLIIGIAGVSIGGFMVTRGAEFIAVRLLVDSFKLTLTKATTLVGLSIVAVGTSLPEMVTSIVAAKKGENEIAFGNIVGSNIFNVLFILGFSSLFSPLGINQDVLIDMIILIPITFFALLFAISKTKVTKLEGLLLILMYTFYLIYIIIRALGIV